MLSDQRGETLSQEQVATHEIDRVAGDLGDVLDPLVVGRDVVSGETDHWIRRECQVSDRRRTERGAEEGTHP